VRENMKIGIVGLGQIAQKGYLPVLTEREDVELIFCTRNTEVLNKLSNKYRIKECVETVEQLIGKNIDAAFVSTATEAHYEVAEKLLKNKINVYIDKPISMNFNETKSIVQMAKDSGVIAMVGFNRRFAPMIKKLKDYGKPDIIIIQKNRFCLPDYTRRFVVEDFIHVVDTLRFLMGTEVKDVKVQHLKKGELNYNVIIQLIGDECTAIGMMNRNNGITEEIIEYMTAGHKYVVDNMVETKHLHDKTISLSKFGEWDPTLYRRGFYQIVDHFIDCVRNHKILQPSIEDSLITHEICERIVEIIGE
jgi:virulence factor